MTINHLIAVFGYGAVFALVAVESLGVPLPGETALIAAATYAGLHGGNHNPNHAHLEVWLIFAVGAAAAVIGDTIGYWIGDKGGFRLLRRYGHYVRLDEPKVKVARYMFARHGGKVVFFGRFVSVLRTYAAFLAGTIGMRYRRFLLFNATGGILWAAIYTFAAYYAGQQLNRFSTTATIVLVIAAVLVIGVGVYLVRRHFSSLQEKAEQAFPGSIYGEQGPSRDAAPLDRTAGDRTAGDRAGTDHAGTDHAGTDHAGTERAAQGAGVGDHERGSG